MKRRPAEPFEERGAEEPRLLQEGELVVAEPELLQERERILDPRGNEYPQPGGRLRQKSWKVAGRSSIPCAT